ncbi:MAG: hypothetical protein AAF802_03165 [Planctomycetota bacterium]
MLAAAVLQVSDTAYFISDSEPVIRRYDISNEEWISPINLPTDDTPTAGHVDSDGIYVAYGTSVYRYDSDGSSEQHLLSTTSDVLAIHSDNNLLLVNHSSDWSGRATSIDKTTNSVIDTAGDSFPERNDVTSGVSVDQTHNRVIGRSAGTGPGDIAFIEYDDEGFFGDSGRNLNHGRFRNTSRTWVFPEDSRVVDDSGNIYSTDSLIWRNSLGTQVSDVAFRDGGLPVVLGGSTLTLYDGSLLPEGTTQLDYTPEEIFVNSDNVITFLESATHENGFRVDAISLASVKPPEPLDFVDPTGLVYAPDEIEVAADGSLLIYSRADSSVFRWDVSSRQYTQSIPLIGSPDFMAYSAVNDTIYLAYSSGLIHEIDLSENEVKEVPFVTLPREPLGLETAGQHVFVVYEVGSRTSYATYGPDGTAISAIDLFDASSNLVWNEANESMFFLRDGSQAGLAKLGISEDGTIGDRRDTPWRSNATYLDPIRVAPDGFWVVLGTGEMFSGVSMQQLQQSLPFEINDAAWVGRYLFTMRNFGGLSEIQAWSELTFEPRVSKQTSTEGIAFLNVNGLLIHVHASNGIPSFEVLNLDLSPSDGTVDSEVRLDFQGQIIENDDASPTESKGTDFGTIKQRENTVARYFELSNVGNVDLEISNLQLPDGFQLGISRGGFDDTGVMTVQPGDHATLFVTLLSDQPGDKSGQLQFETNDLDNPTFSVTLAGNVEFVETFDTIGLYQQDPSIFHLKEDFARGPTDHYFSFGPTSESWSPLIGDWDGDGTDGIGLYQADLALFHLKNEFAGGTSDHHVGFGPAGNNWIPLAGDWNGDGIDTIGLYEPELGFFHLKDTFTSGDSDHYFRFGPNGNAGWVPLAGDWNGDGIDTIGLYQPDISLFHLKDSFAEGASDHYLAFGPSGDPGWLPLAGDWDGDDVDTVGLFQPDISLFHFKNSFVPGPADQYVTFGPGGDTKWTPLVGDWNGNVSGSAPVVLLSNDAGNARHIKTSNLDVSPLILTTRAEGMKRVFENDRSEKVASFSNSISDAPAGTSDETQTSEMLALIDESLTLWGGIGK